MEREVRESYKILYCCCSLRTASLVLGYLGLVGYPMMLTTYLTLLFVYWEIEECMKKIFWTKFVLNRIFDMIIIIISILLILSIYKDKPFYMTIWIYLQVLLIFWCFVNIVTSLIFLNALSVGFFLILITWFTEGLFLVRTYKLLRDMEEQNLLNQFAPYGFRNLRKNQKRKESSKRLSMSTSVRK